MRLVDADYILREHEYTNWVHGKSFPYIEAYFDLLGLLYNTPEVIITDKDKVVITRFNYEERN
jgi:hypothetical protein